jgi:polyisoprenoid-binding protein YceI
MTDTIPHHTPTSPAPAGGTRVVDGRAVPAVGTWNVDPSHSEVAFTAKHLVVSKVRGRFADYTVSLTVAGDPTQSSVEVEIQAGTIATGDDQRDAHLTGPDFLDVDRFPTLSFRSTNVEPVGNEAWSVHGDLTIRDVTRPVVLDVEFLGVTEDPWGNQRSGFTAATEIDREDWGLTWNQPLANGGVLVGKKVKIEIDVQAVKA